MKYHLLSLLIVLLLSFFTFQSSAQCVNGNIETWRNTWESCRVTSNPNPQRSPSHWVRYDFGTAHRLSKSRIWNANDPTKLNTGFRNVIVDYSLDGTTWTELGTYEFTQGTGEAIYGGFEGPDFAAIRARYVLFTATSNWGDASCYGLAEVKFNLSKENPIPENSGPACESPSTRTLNLTAMLQGPYTSGEMTTLLSSLIPTTDPYTRQASFNTLPPDAVDWVLVQARDANNLSQVLWQQAALIQKNGQIISSNGSPGIQIPGNLPNMAHIAILHKSHLGIVSAAPVVLSGSYDFSNPATPVMGNSSRAIIGNRALLHVGDYDGNGIINNLDFNLWRQNAATINQYLNTDGDANGVNNNLDFNLWKLNASLIGNLPMAPN
ncbi:MAG: discoidin domain-containing protein [Bacteroidota bacterium]